MDFLYNNFIASGFSTAIEWMYHTIFGNWILAILIIAFLLRLVLSPLDFKQKKTTYNMARMKPKMDKINKKYANDPRKKNEKLSELYRSEKISPYSSCLPLLFQMVFLLAFYGAVRSLSNIETVRMVSEAYANNGAAVQMPGFLWIKNIWQPDAVAFTAGATNLLPSGESFVGVLKTTPALVETFKLPAEWANLATLSGEEYTVLAQQVIAQYSSIMHATLQPYMAVDGSLGQLLLQSNGYFILPLVAGGTTFWLNHMQGQSASQDMGKIMKFGLPIFMIFICLSIGSAFAFYWTFTNLLGVAQQFIFNRFYIRRRQEAEATAILEAKRASGALIEQPVQLSGDAPGTKRSKKKPMPLPVVLDEDDDDDEDDEADGNKKSGSGAFPAAAFEFEEPEPPKKSVAKKKPSGQPKQSANQPSSENDTKK